MVRILGLQRAHQGVKFREASQILEASVFQKKWPASKPVIDRAINESRAALAQEPASVLAQESLLEALDTKVALLQDTVALASDAGGLPEDAAAASKEVNQ